MTEFYNDTLVTFVSYFYKLPELIQIIWIIIIVEFFLIITSFIFLSYIRLNFARNKKRHKLLNDKYQELLINFIYLTDEEIKEKKALQNQLQKAVKNKFEREVIQKLILKLHADLSGELATFLEELYSNLNLVYYSLKKMKSNVWYIKIKGIREVTQMKVKGVYGETLKLINHDNILLRNEAQLTMVKLYQFKGLAFLDKLEFPITEWQQLQLIEEIQSIRNEEIPDLTQWLKSENEYVVIFALKLVKLFNQIQTQDLLLKLIMHPSKLVRKNAIAVLEYFKIDESKTLLKQIFSKSDIDTQRNIIQALANLSNEEDVPFFESQLNNADVEISYLACKAIQELKPFLATVKLTK